MKVKTITQLAAEYGVSRTTIVIWLKDADLLKLRVGRLFPPSALVIIYKHFGDPKEYKEC
jgi:hypothetical protein